MRFYCDEARHLVCVPYSVSRLHLMAKTLGIKRCWFHSHPTHAHYDIPKKRVAEVKGRCIVVSGREIMAVCKGEHPMSRSTETDIMPFVLHSAFTGQDTDEDLHPLCSIAMHLENKGEDPELDTAQLELEGWTCRLHHGDPVGKRRRLYAGDVCSKGDMRVFLINEDQYSSVGEFDVAACADSKEALEAFIADFGLQGTVEEGDTVQQTM